MPPSPALRFSPTGELNQKSDGSLDCGLCPREEDDDLALFSDIQTRERANFLLDSSVDIGDPLSYNLSPCLNFSTSILVQGESNDLFVANDDKNDYDWLLTPPDTPLFISLDDDDPPPCNLGHGWRLPSQPISVSNSSMKDNNGSNIQSASPLKLSPPRYGSSTIHAQARPSYTHHLGPSPNFCCITSSERPSISVNEVSIADYRFSIPVVQRSEGSSTIISSSKRLPRKANHVNSASPKLRAWRSTLPNFSSYPPTNLRASPSDRHALHMRGLSPSSQSGRESCLKFRTQPMSPKAFTNADSMNSYNADRLCPEKNGFVMSSVDDNMDSIHSVPSCSLKQPTMRKKRSPMNRKTVTFTKKLPKMQAMSCASRCLIDYASPQMDYHKGPQNTFSPLASNIQSTNSSVERRMMSLNSSITERNDASFGHDRAALDTEGNVPDQDDLNCECKKTTQAVASEQPISVISKVDDTNEDAKCDEGKPAYVHGGFANCSSNLTEADVSKIIDISQPGEIVSKTSSVWSLVPVNPLEADVCESIANCSICGGKLIRDTDICSDCSEKGGSLTFRATESALLSSHDDTTYKMVLGESKSVCELDAGVTSAELPEQAGGTYMSDKDERKVEEGQGLSAEKLGCHNQCHLDTEDTSIFQVDMDNYFSSTAGCRSATMKEMEVSLKRSSSSKWPTGKENMFSHTTLSCDNPFYVRHGMNSLRSYSGAGSSSTSSSIDLNSLIRIQRKLIYSITDTDMYRDDLNSKLVSSRSSLSEISDDAYESLAYTWCSSEAKLDYSFNDVSLECAEENLKVSEYQGAIVKEQDMQLFVGSAIPECKVDQLLKLTMTASLALDLTSPQRSVQLDDNLVLEHLHDNIYDKSGIAERDVQISERNMSDVSGTILLDDSKTKEDAMVDAIVQRLDVLEDPIHDTLVMASAELEENFESVTVSKTENEAPLMVEAFANASDTTVVWKDGSSSPMKSEHVDPSLASNDEAKIKDEGPRGQKARSLTLEEATDTILFCNSITHSLAYDAANIAIENELVHLRDGSRSNVTILNSMSEISDSHVHTSAKQGGKSSKIKHKQLDPDAKSPSSKSDKYMKDQYPFLRDKEISHKHDSMKPPKLEPKCNCTVM